jgi:hypothetical protein
MIFPRRQVWYMINKLLKFYIVFYMLTISNEKAKKLESYRSLQEIWWYMMV